MKNKSGVKTSEFWTVIATKIATGLTLVFHHSFAGYVPAIAIASSAVASGAYAFARSKNKAAFLQSEANKLFALTTETSGNSTVMPGNTVESPEVADGDVDEI